MIKSIDHLKNGQKVYFASDFHLGMPNPAESLEREKKIVRWLNSIENDAKAVFILGDIFDFWFEYKHAIPKGFIRIQGKFAELTDKGITVVFFTGNHDMWMFDYFTKELNIAVYRKAQEIIISGKKFLTGHGDGLGPHDKLYKLIKKIFESKICQWLFAWIHPNAGIAIGHYASKRSRLAKDQKEKFMGEKEWLFNFCKQIESNSHHDYYIFGHRHLPMDMDVSENSRYINLGEWVHHCAYAVFDGEKLELKYFET
ncbi:MAG: UDP-2,3-diacylglucosamine diphosphatase [Cytophagales bacterium]|nr:UDP-2,3-diacylglucosamine diphosphatase [Cytophagales bacterium]